MDRERGRVGGVNPTCEWCGKELVEVDNPLRREVRHRRGEDGAACPGPFGIPEELRPTAAQAAAGLSGPPALAACPICSETWWTVRRTVRIAAAVLAGNANQRACEPVAQEVRVMVVCSGCGYCPP